jgi:glycosyltransferase involved in cell wall biosynthesis
MGWHVLSSTYFDFGRFERESKADTLPHHLLPKIAERLNAKITQPSVDDVRTVDRMLSRIYARPEHWALARKMCRQLKPGDAVYTAGSDAGVPLALLCALRRKKVSFAINFADPSRSRTKAVGWLLAFTSIKLIAFVTTDYQAKLLNKSFGRRLYAVHVVEGQTDCNFFRPLEDKPTNTPPLIASCGVERRDYRTMATALADSDIEAMVCFASPNQTSKTKFTLPEVTPDNFTFELLEFIELRTLYQKADVVVLPLLKNRYSAGLTTLFEAIACGAPIVVSESPGIIQRLIDEGVVLGVPPGDHGAMRAAVDKILADPVAAAKRAEAAREVVLDRYSATTFVNLLDGILTDFTAAMVES